MKALLLIAAMATPALADPLTVEIKPATLTWKHKAKVEVTLVVSNPTKKKQSMEVMTCSWEDNWKSSDPELTWDSWGCEKNYPGGITLEPGQSRQWKLEMFARTTVNPGPHPLTMTFTPGLLAPSKSNTVTITVTR